MKLYFKELGSFKRRGLRNDGHLIHFVFRSRTSSDVFESALQSGYDAAADNKKIEMQAATFIEDLDLARNISVMLQGGYECGYLSNPGWTTVHGRLTITDGSVTLENVRIR